jgi:hypothetical protein
MRNCSRSFTWPDTEKPPGYVTDQHDKDIGK